MNPTSKLTFVIHDLNPWGGHDRSTLEIARRLSHRFPIDVYAFTLDDPEGMNKWGKVNFHPIRPNLRRPVLAKITWFYGATLPALTVLPIIKSKITNEQTPLIHSTGTCSLASDIVQVQFVNAAWKKVRDRVETRPSFLKHRGPKEWVKKIYHDVLLNYNVAIEHQVYSKDKTYIAIADVVAEELGEYFGISKNIKVIHHGVDSEKFHPLVDPNERKAIRKSWGVDDTDFVGIFVGAYLRKGIETVINAMSLLPDEMKKKFKVVAVGDGPAEALRKKANFLGVGENLILKSHTKEISSQYRAADFFVMPTYYEPFGLVILEAMASGLPTVTSALAGAADLIQNKKNGLLIKDPWSAKEVAGHIQDLFWNADKRKSMAKAARMTAQKQSWDRVADEYAEVFEPMLFRKSA
jgi:glycosyltransferase involved in cell wall biosynthesis